MAKKKVGDLSKDKLGYWRTVRASRTSITRCNITWFEYWWRKAGLSAPGDSYERSIYAKIEARGIEG